ncbi:hypothetical protein J6X15_03965 [Candidatus Saccharibacteria bacterium]|nr:hypothetical protein [Candidatus Saccharibacteria bacterium]
MDNDPKPGDDTDKKMEELMSDPNIENNTEGDGFGSTSHELEVDKEAVAEAEAEKEAEEEKVEVVDGPVIATDEKAEKKEKSKKRSGILAIIVVLLLVGCGALAFVMFGTKPSEQKNTASGGEQQEEESGIRLSGNELSNFDLKFLQLENNEKNVIYSPLSIKYALAMLKDGADGDTKKQIEDVIGDYKAKKYINGRNLSLANAMFIRNSYKEQVLDSYIEGLKTNYNADVVFDAFEKPDAMNKWVNEKTLGLINNIVSEKDLENLNYGLVNALAIDQNWNYLLQCQHGRKVPCKQSRYSVNYAHENYTQYVPTIGDEESFASMKFGDFNDRKAVKIAASFNNYDIIKEIGEDKIREKVTEEYKKWLESEEVQYEKKNNPDNYAERNLDDVKSNVDEYMTELKANYGKEDSSTDFYLNDAEDAKVFAKDLKEYDGTTLQYVGIMPKETELKSFVENMTAKTVADYISGLKELKKENFEDGKITKIDATIPLFKYDYDLKLMEDLQGMGIKDVFDSNKSNLTKISKESSFIAVAKHKATIEFSNEGIKAGAATMMGGAGAGGLRFEYLWDVPVVEIDLSFNKPFMYLIRDKNSGEVWFTGMVYKPIEKKAKNNN